MAYVHDKLEDVQDYIEELEAHIELLKSDLYASNLEIEFLTRRSEWLESELEKS